MAFTKALARDTIPGLAVSIRARGMFLLHSLGMSIGSTAKSLFLEDYFMPNNRGLQRKKEALEGTVFRLP
jgi:hypothetical protein